MLSGRAASLVYSVAYQIDNIPGIPGVGQKTATKLLDKYGDLDGILAHVDELKGKHKERFEDYRDQVLLSRELVTIDQKVPLDVGLDDLMLPEVAASELNALYKRLEFYSLLSEEEAAKDQAAAADADFAAIESLAQLDALLASLPGPEEGAAAIFPVYDAPSPVRGELAGLALSTGPKHARFIGLANADGIVESSVEILVG